MGVVRNEEITPAEAGHGDRQAPDNPVGEVKIVAAFLQQMRAGVGALAPPVAEDVAAVIVIERLVELEGDDLPDGAAADEFADFLVKERIAQHEPEGEGAARFAYGIADGEAVIGVGGERLFAEDVLAGEQRCAGVPRVAGIP